MWYAAHAFTLIVLLSTTIYAHPVVSTSTNITTSVRVAHGTPVTLREVARSMAYVISRAHGTYCSATIIASSWILLAAHCSVAPNDPVRVGAYRNYPGSLHALRGVHRHHRFTKAAHGLLSDVMIAEIYPPVQPNVAIKLNYDGSQPHDNSQVYGFGYGVDELNRHALKLRAAQFHAVSITQCRQKLARARHPSSARSISPRVHMCANEDTIGRGMCDGDSGGPLIMKTRSGFVQVGIYSYRVTRRCGSTERPDIYARVSSFYGWARYVIGRGTGRVPDGFVL